MTVTRIEYILKSNYLNKIDNGISNNVDIEEKNKFMK